MNLSDISDPELKKAIELSLNHQRDDYKKRKAEYSIEMWPLINNNEKEKLTQFLRNHIDFTEFLTIDDLKRLMIFYGLKVSGIKIVLVNRIRGFILNNDQSDLARTRACLYLKKKTIPKSLKKAVWDHYIGIDKGQVKCLVCDNINITQLDFECGHVEAESSGGRTNLANLRPICKLCNSSMQTTNMKVFCEEHFPHAEVLKYL